MTHPTRPPLLNPLFAPARSLKGVGPRVEALLNKLFGISPPNAARVIDLLWHLPIGVIDRKLIASIAEGRIGELVTLEVTVAEHRPGGPRRSSRAPYRVLVEDDTSALELVYFNADSAYLKRLLPRGSRRIISGRLEAYDGSLQMPHPDHVIDAEKSSLPSVEPVYPLTAGLSNTSLRKLVAQALERL
ncbi:MAG TPA: OB-fold nucleic acid binding domain-containing protein, partial [Methyloceanibacter sp.]